MQVCLTQEMIDKYGAIVPENLTNACQLVNVVKKRGGMTADMVCSGGITGKGVIEVNWTDSEHTKGTLHFAGVIHPRDTDIKLEWTAEPRPPTKAPRVPCLQPRPRPLRRPTLRRATLSRSAPSVPSPPRLTCKMIPSP